MAVETQTTYGSDLRRADKGEALFDSANDLLRADEEEADIGIPRPRLDPYFGP